MFNSRKGVSEVVANVLIVLLVIVGIAVIWSVVKPTIDRGAAGVQADCFTVNVEPVTCVANGANSWNVTVKRNPGAGTIENVELVFEDTNGNTRTFAPTTAVTPTELSTATITATGVRGLGSGVTANTVLRVGGQLCQITSQPVNC